MKKCRDRCYTIKKPPFRTVLYGPAAIAKAMAHCRNKENFLGPRHAAYPNKHGLTPCITWRPLADLPSIRQHPVSSFRAAFFAKPASCRFTGSSLRIHLARTGRKKVSNPQ